jgi:hypothetical protein
MRYGTAAPRRGAASAVAGCMPVSGRAPATPTPTPARCCWAQVDAGLLASAGDQSLVPRSPVPWRAAPPGLAAPPAEPVPLSGRGSAPREQLLVTRRKGPSQAVRGTGER